MSDQPLLVLRNLTKTYGGVQALRDASLEVQHGEVFAVVGENGAGKSTMMKIVAGAVFPTSGTMEVEGKPVTFSGPRDAADAGIAIVYQEPAFFSELSVVENIYLGSEIRTATGALDWGRMTDGAAEALEAIGLSSTILHSRMAELSVGAQQLVLIARSVHRNCKLLILDEPTAILSLSETNILFSAIRTLKQRGVSILYISHRLDEIFTIADRLCVLRDGQLIVTSDVDKIDADALITAMTGRKVSTDVYTERNIEVGAPILEVQNLTRAGNYRDISFSLHAGEVLGLYGLVGSGRSELARAVYGELLPDAGEIRYHGAQITPRRPQESIAKGILYVPEDRRSQGLFPIRSTSDNLTAGILRKLTRVLGIIDSGRERTVALDLMQQLRIKASSPEAPVSSLSGGNQQKVVLGRGLSHKPAVLMLDEPTHGIDVGTKTEIHRLIMELAQDGLAILLISSDLPEVLALADGVIVMREGSLVDTLGRDEMSEERILRSALGLGQTHQQPIPIASEVMA